MAVFTFLEHLILVAKSSDRSVRTKGAVWVGVFLISKSFVQAQSLKMVLPFTVAVSINQEKI